MITVIVLCVVAAVLVLADVILVYSLRVLNNKVIKKHPEKEEKNTPEAPTED